MLLAAGLGTRLRPLTARTPKPLLPLAGKPMLQYHIERLVAAGITELVINLSWLGEQIEARFGDGARLGARIRYSREPGAPLDTGGGVRRALPLLGNEPFLVVAGDIWCEYPFARLAALPPQRLGTLVVVPNPPQHAQGDFHLAPDGRLNREGRGTACTYAGIALLAPALLAGYEEEVFPLREPLRAAAARGLLEGTRWDGDWEDVGTPERYAALDRRLAAALSSPG
jgi:MurNAc alpha-1-phosphate uridylyltransferase